jgi:hypothetical protein
MQALVYKFSRKVAEEFAFHMQGNELTSVLSFLEKQQKGQTTMSELSKELASFDTTSKNLDIYRDNP